MIGSSKINFPSNPIISEELKDFFSLILNSDPKERIKAKDIKKHKWLN